jgi:AcrR family transcriptional regulator
MGRTAGTTAADTRERLLSAAADAFARRGYDGTRVVDIAEAAGLSNGALYTHFDSKAGLLVGALRAHGRRLLAELMAADPERSVPDLLLEAGRSLARRQEPEGFLVIEALTAARRDREVALPMRDYVRERVDWLAAVVRQAQERGEIDRGVSPHAVAHFCLALAVGAALVPPELDDVGDGDWGEFLARLVSALVPSPADPPRAESQSEREPA